MNKKRTNTDADKAAKENNYPSPGGPVALIMAGYNRVDFLTKRMLKREIADAYDGEEIYIGKNKFLITLAGKPVIQYVLDAVYNAQLNGKRIYDKIYIYNDVESFTKSIDLRKYDNVVVHQMKDSVGGHWKDFYNNSIEYGQRVDVFFGDTPRITPEDVACIHIEYGKILGVKRDFKNVPICMIFGIVEYNDMKDDNWLPHRIKFIKHGPNKGKLKSFVGFEHFNVRVGNSGSMIKQHCMDNIINYELMNFSYNHRKALSPRTFSKIVYYLWKTKNFDMIRQVKNKCINERGFYQMLFDVFSKLFKEDFNSFGAYLFHIKKNAAHWENDVDGPRDYEVFKRKMIELRNNRKK